MVETRAGRRVVRMAARYRLPRVLLDLPLSVKALAARAGMIAQFWEVEARSKAAIPLMTSRASCGFPSPADDYIDKRICFNEQLIAHPAATFVLEATGDSMIGVGIFDGDKVVVDRALELHDGAIIVADLHGDFTIKTYRCRGGRCWLHAENPKYPDIEINESIGFEFWGVVTTCLRSLTVRRR